MTAGGGRLDDAQRVVVGLDGSTTSRLALRVAVEEARALGAVLEVVTAWSYLDQLDDAESRSHPGEEGARRMAEAVLADELGGEQPAGLVVTVVNDLPGRALVDAGAGAVRVVVGSRGLGALSRLALGSVSSYVVHRAPCPVLVVPGDRDA